MNIYNCLNMDQGFNAITMGVHNLEYGTFTLHPVAFEKIRDKKVHFKQPETNTNTSTSTNDEMALVKQKEDEIQQQSLALVNPEKRNIPNIPICPIPNCSCQWIPDKHELATRKPWRFDKLVPEIHRSLYICKKQPNAEEVELQQCKTACMQTTFKKPYPSATSKLSDRLLFMFQSRYCPDVVISIDKKMFFCHMAILQNCSEFFKQQTNKKYIKLPSNKVTPCGFAIVYEWMLTKNAKVHRSGFIEIFSAALYLRITHLLTQCYECLNNERFFSEHTAFLLYWEARQLNMTNLVKPILSRVSRFFLILVATKEFLELNANEICVLLSSSNIGVNIELEVLWSAIRWLSHNWEQRERYFIKVIRCVRFEIMPAYCLGRLLNYMPQQECKECEVVLSRPEMSKMVNEGLAAYISAQLNQSTDTPQRKWIFDKTCEYHRCLNCTKKLIYPTYCTFQQYLRQLRKYGKNYLDSFVSADGDLSKECCDETAEYTMQILQPDGIDIVVEP